MLGAWWLATATAFLVALLLMSGYLAREHRRMTSVQTALTWASEAVSGFWFLRFGVRHILGGVPLARADARATFRPVLLSLLAGFALDAGLTAYKWREEAVAFERATPVEGQVVSARRSPFGPREGRTRYYHLTCTFADADGEAWTVEYLEPDWWLPGATVSAVETGRLPAPLPLRYDPDWPARTWMPHGSEDTGERVYILTSLPLLLQFLFLAIAAARRNATLHTSAGPAPLEQVLPFTCSAWGLLVVSLFVWAAEGSW